MTANFIFKKFDSELGALRIVFEKKNKIKYTLFSAILVTPVAA